MLMVVKPAHSYSTYHYMYFFSITTLIINLHVYLQCAVTLTSPIIYTGTYHTQVPATTVVNTVVFTCVATDRDTQPPFNTLTYEMVMLDNTAGLYFDVRSNGDIVLTNSILHDNLDKYQVLYYIVTNTIRYCFISCELGNLTLIE